MFINLTNKQFIKFINIILKHLKELKLPYLHAEWLLKDLFKNDNLYEEDINKLKKEQFHFLRTIIAIFKSVDKRVILDEYEEEWNFVILILKVLLNYENSFQYDVESNCFTFFKNKDSLATSLNIISKENFGKEFIDLLYQEDISIVKLYNLREEIFKLIIKISDFNFLLNSQIDSLSDEILHDMAGHILSFMLEYKINKHFVTLHSYREYNTEDRKLLDYKIDNKNIISIKLNLKKKLFDRFRESDRILYTDPDGQILLGFKVSLDNNFIDLYLEENEMFLSDRVLDNIYQFKDKKLFSYVLITSVRKQQKSYKDPKVNIDKNTLTIETGDKIYIYNKIGLPINAYKILKFLDFYTDLTSTIFKFTPNY